MPKDKIAKVGLSQVELKEKAPSDKLRDDFMEPRPRVANDEQPLPLIKRGSWVKSAAKIKDSKNKKSCNIL